jgi:hypothetical protein
MRLLKKSKNNLIGNGEIKMDRMNFNISGVGSAKGFEGRGTCQYFDVDSEMRAIKKEWKRNEIVSMFALTLGNKKIPEEYREYFEQKQEHSGNLTLRKMQFEESSAFPEDDIGLRYDISLGGFMFNESMMTRMHLYSEEGQDYIDMEFVLKFVRWGCEK